MNDSDDYDFTPSSNSTLASLFDNSTLSSENSSLTYTAPKQPKLVNIPEQQNEPTKIESSVICARVVQAWKLTDTKYISLGKHGIAVIGSSVHSSYEIIIYRDKHNVIIRVKLTPKFEVSLKKDNFMTFYDNAKDNWLIKFNSRDDCTTFTSHLKKNGGKVINVENITTEETEDNVKNTDNSQNKAKADILSRIAKMGQAILPNKDVDEEEIFENKDTVEVKQEQAQPPRQLFNSENTPAGTEYVSSALTPTNIQPSRSIQNNPTTFIMGQPMSYDPLNFYISENRAHNSEIRLNMSQISEKLNHIMNLMATDKPNSGSDVDVLKSKVKVLELRNENLVKELTGVQENRILKVKMENKGREENEKLQLSLAENCVRLEEMERELVTYKQNGDDYNKVIEQQKVEIEQLRSQLEDDTKSKEKISRLESTISDLELKLKDHEKIKISSEEESKIRNSNFTTMLKEEMNGMYAKIVSKFSEDQLSASDVSSIIAQNIKFTTLKIIQNFQQTYDSRSEET